MKRKTWIPSTLLVLAIVVVGAMLAAWKQHTRNETAAASQNQSEPSEVIRTAIATKREHRRTSTSIGTVLALQSVTLRNELAGTVKFVSLAPGAIVEPGAVLVALDVSVEQAELAALEAQAVLAEANLERAQRLVRNNAAAVADVERATAERDVAIAQITRTKAIIDRKTIRAPFRARVGLADLHPGQFLEAGTLLTSLQSLDTEAHVDFNVTQDVASQLQPGDHVDLLVRGDKDPTPARIVAVNARVDPLTRNATVRARFGESGSALLPGTSVRVRVAEGPVREAVAIPANALRRGPAGDQVFVIEPDPDGLDRAYARIVEAGLVSGNDVLIFSGLKPGERVAASGSFKLRESVPVTIADEPVLAASIR